ncbi:hypothetical protein LQG66_04455 [Bradyrhizobium ontarionense]|uniref:Uncharacterized protein n=1 Tax=Bradyrhizobium ontarionense TaxID=2898149 RepID=A0ABY3RFH3_9BRAD|nr:hypothetical protein [Bradyrhizobium sp. A19]UFZ05576.1 hypothetical protein LQG66_04455 [Bradyrhizobium sp. A19]
MTRWHPRLELTRLLDALSEDIIAATDEEVRQLHGRAVAGAAREVKRLVKAARADKGSGAMAGLNDPGSGLRPVGAARRPSHQQRH